MKTVKSLSMITGVKAFEETLARQESKRLEDAIPEGHPLKEEADKQKALLGDLSNLPPGHPLLIGLEQAKERFEKAKQAKASGVIEPAIKKVRKIEDAENHSRRIARQNEDEQTDMRLSAAKTVNGCVDETLITVQNLWKVLADNEELLNNHPISRARVLRLKRLLFATERGLSECKMAKS